MTLYFIGLGLGEQDIAFRGVKIAKKCSVLYLESYTSKVVDVSKLKKLIGKDLITANREMVESKAEETILKDAKEKDVGFLVMGDVFSATTHIDLFLRAKSLGINVKVVNAGSIITAVGITGLSLYNFGKITSVPFNYENIKTPVEVIKKNLSLGMHTLILFDLDVEKNSYMNVNEVIRYLLKNGIEDRLCVGCAGLGNDDAEIKSGKLSEVEKKHFTKYPQCLIVCGNLHFKEEEALRLWMK